MPNTPGAFIANGNIPVCTFVKIAGDNIVDPCNVADEFAIGVAFEGGRAAPTPDYPSTIYAAIAGDPIKVYGEGEECLIKLSETLVAGDRVVTTNAGLAKKFVQQNTAELAVGNNTTITNIVGVMLEGGAVNTLRRMMVTLAGPAFRVT